VLACNILRSITNDVVAGNVLDLGHSPEHADVLPAELTRADDAYLDTHGLLLSAGRIASWTLFRVMDRRNEPAATW